MILILPLSSTTTLTYLIFFTHSSCNTYNSFRNFSTNIHTNNSFQTCFIATRIVQTRFTTQC